MMGPEVARARRLARTHLTRSGLTNVDRCPVQNLGIASLPNLNRMRHAFPQRNNLLVVLAEDL
jgi:hypothetical protein